MNLKYRERKKLIMIERFLYILKKLNVKKFFKYYVSVIIFLLSIKIDLVFNQIEEENFARILSRVLLSEF